MLYRLSNIGHLSANILIESTDIEEQVKNDIMSINGKYSVTSISDLTELISSVLGTITLGLSAFSGVALFVAAFGIINTQLMSVFERTKEIGLLKSLGMPNRKVRSLFSYEAIIIGVIGALVGTALAYGVQAFVNNVFKEKLADIGFVNGILNIAVSDVLMVVVGLGLLSWVAGVIPARKAQKLDPIQALREE
jgi:putative ABC transport system permease protein